MPNYPRLPEDWPHPKISEAYRRQARRRASKRRGKRVDKEVADILNMRKGKSLKALMGIKVE